ncbi:Transcriptional regulator, LacI family [Rubrivivax sp. A210]|uniref:LacI family DNA-binding transcriptional regulator n=1 Tax=Rubrivivax sp. A210 TaxID=2772301 RepID=UPI001919BE32|nr:substrate-binding domain-containing protein [Rubrivivax sp. A210]CAD5366230.1 Transcriptional regulator, LacI family [Rubrivivax sp. A210]
MAVPPSTRNAPSPHAHGGGRLTLKHVAQAMGVSRTTVSNAFSRPGQLSEELRDSILSKARELGYWGPDPRARALRRGGLHEVGVIFHHDLSYALSDPTSLRFLAGVAKELDARQLTLQLVPKMGRKLLLGAAFQTTADAMIVHAEIGPELVPELNAAGKPVVLVDSMVAGFASVGIPDREGAALAMAHALAAAPDVVVVLSLPHSEPPRTQAGRRAGLLREVPATAFVGTERAAGYALGALRAGFPSERMRWLTVDDWAPETAAERVAALRPQLAAGTRVALVAMSDRIALAAQRVVRGWRGIKVVALVGFDDIPAAAAAGLTTIRHDPFRKGELCVRVLLDGATPRKLPLELVKRAT